MSEATKPVSKAEADALEKAKAQVYVFLIVIATGAALIVMGLSALLGWPGFLIGLGAALIGFGFWVLS